MSEQSLIYVTEDDESIRELIRCTLEAFSYRVETFGSAEEMLKACTKQVPELFLLDIMLPGIDGISALKQLKANEKTREIPAIMLTARTSEVDKVKGLDMGAEDYITKPFGILELTARVRARLRAVSGANRGKEPRIISCADIEIDTEGMEVFQRGRKLELTLKEYELLKFLLKHADKVVSRDELLNAVWGFDYTGETRTLDMHIKGLRSKLGDNAEKPQYIKTIRGVGYKFIYKNE